MFDLIERLRQKPEKTKKRIAFSVAFSFSLTILIVWFTVLYPDFNNDKSGEVANVSSSGPVENIGDIFRAGFAKVGEAISEVKSTMSDIASTTSTYYGTSSVQSSVDTGTNSQN
jgi:hypothetical protein